PSTGSRARPPTPRFTRRPPPCSGRRPAPGSEPYEGLEVAAVRRIVVGVTGRIRGIEEEQVREPRRRFERGFEGEAGARILGCPRAVKPATGPMAAGQIPAARRRYCPGTPRLIRSAF